jgi:cytochrome b
MPPELTPTTVAPTTVVVWDVVVRVLHGVLIVSLALLVVGLCTSWTLVHQPAGYTALGAALVRTVWGWLGKGQTRFGAFLRSPQTTWGYTQQLAHGHPPRYLGHNPLGGWMVVALLLCVVSLGLTGWLYTTDAFWGNAALEWIHHTLAWLLLGLVLLHWLGVALMSWRYRENLVAAMLHGRKTLHKTTSTK